ERAAGDTAGRLPASRIAPGARARGARPWPRTGKTPVRPAARAVTARRGGLLAAYSAAWTRVATSAGTHLVQTSDLFFRNHWATADESSPDSSMCARVWSTSGSGMLTLDRNSVSLGACVENSVLTAVNTGFSG